MFCLLYNHKTKDFGTSNIKQVFTKLWNIRTCKYANIYTTEIKTMIKACLVEHRPCYHLLSYTHTHIYIYIYIYSFQGGSNIRPRPICFELEQYGQDYTSIISDSSVQGGDKKHGFQRMKHYHYLSARICLMLYPMWSSFQQNIFCCNWWLSHQLHGYVELLQVLNHLGHSMSYSVTQPIDSALCVQKTESVGKIWDTPDA